MSVCPDCGTYHREEREGETLEHCRNCGKLLQDEENTTSEKEDAVEEVDETQEDAEDDKDDDVEDDEEEEEDEKSNYFLSTVLPLVCSFSLGCVLAFVGCYYFYRPTPEVPSAVETTELQQEQTIQPEEPVQFVLQSLSVLSEKGISFGDTVEEVTTILPELFAMSGFGNHFGLFQSDLTLPLDETVALGTIFYYFDTEFLLQSVEYTLKPKDGGELSTEEISYLEELLSKNFTLIPSNSPYLVWQATDGFIGLDIQQQYLYLTQEKELLGRMVDATGKS